ncbi:glycosyltransferase family 2 protein [Aeromonas veronii]|uniref:glycosyltransferase family 2 protein n=1 Tax=Aeromonas veronii TaxID=654 RepID=UPI0038D31328
MGSDDEKVIVAVIVTYYPDDDFNERLACIYQLVDRVVVVDNTPPDDAQFIESIQHVSYISMNGNKGIAAALNAGASYSFKYGADFVIFFDQDSNPDSFVINSLTNVISSFNEEELVAVVGPAYYDTRLQKIAPFIKFQQGKLHRIPPEGESLIDVDYLITSGAMISRKSWEVIGCHDETLFIDYVDIEWCLRAKSRGWRVIGVPYVVMEHTLGDDPINVFGKKLPVHSPIRHYYFFRNCISLLRRDYIPSGFKVREFCFIPIRFFVYALFTRDKLSHITKMCKGLLDGVLSRSGPYR